MPTVNVLVLLFWTLLLIQASHGYQMRFGMTLPMDNPQLKSIFSYETSASAITLALDRVKRENLLPGANFSFVIKNCECREEIAAGHVIDMLEEEMVDVVVSSPCPAAAFVSAVLATRFNVPLLNWAVSTAEMDDTGRFKIVMRTIGASFRIGRAVSELVTFFGWHRVAVFYTDDKEARKCYSIGQGVTEYLTRSGVRVQFVQIAQGVEPSDSDADRFLNVLQKSARIAIICLDKGIRRLMLRAQERAMTTDDYVYLLPEHVQNENRSELWTNYEAKDGRNTEARAAFNASIFIEMQLAPIDDLRAFKRRIPERMRQAPFLHSKAKRDEFYGSLYSPFLHDAIYMYALAVNRTLKRGGQISDGRRVAENARKLQFHGFSGMVTVDERGNRDAVFAVKVLSKENRLWNIARIQTHKKDRETVELLVPEPTLWEQRGGARPTGEPRCGWADDKCPHGAIRRLLAVWLPVVIGGTVIAMILIVVISVLCVRKRSTVRKVSLSTWKISYKDLTLLKDLHSSRNTLNSAASDETSEAMTKSGDTIAQYKGQLIWMKVHHSNALMAAEKDQMDLKSLKEMNHENLNQFIGLCTDGVKPIALWQYCSKGSLEDVLLNSTIKLDWFFKYSLIKDLAYTMQILSDPALQGLEFLHHTYLQSHGRLKSSNCLIDARWVLKLTDYGLGQLREGVAHAARDKLWMAPELLRLSRVPVYGSPKADVYSFGIIVSEVISRDKAFGMYDGMSSEEITSKVRRGDNPPFRPTISAEREAETDSHVISLMKDCWIEEPERRPDMKEVRGVLKQMGSGKTTSLMDHVLKMMETHAKALEVQVNERTKQLNDEMKKSDALLYRMLPPVIAERLKRGQQVEPETYDSVSIFFSNVAGFSSIAQRASPYQLIAFLNDICTMFDSILDKYDVFKVETVNDGYLVVSGLPHRNGNKHASEIADMALELGLAIVSFSIASMPKEKFEIRCGIHTGPVVAGVVGIALPRYCLFGDTVNVANRIETNGKPSCIHISEETNKFLTLVIGGYITKPRGEIIVKGKGVMYTYWLLGRDKDAAPDKPAATEVMAAIEAAKEARLDGECSQSQKVIQSERAESIFFRAD